MPWLLQYADVPVTVSAESDSAARLADVALASMRCTEMDHPEGAHLSVAGRDGAWRLVDHASDVVRRARAPGDLVYHLTDRIVHHVACAARRHHCLHAAAVGYRGKALVMPANSGSGKSLLTAWLVSRGFEYMSDELVLVDEQQTIEGLARPLLVKKPGLPAARTLPGVGDRIIEGRRSNVVPVELLGDVSAGSARYRPGIAVFPEFSADADFRLSPLTPAQAGMKFVPCHINARNLPGHGFSSLMALVRTMPCYALQYGGFDRLPDDFAARLQGLLTGP